MEAVLRTTTPRFGPYRAALGACKNALQKCGIDTKRKMEKRKWLFIRTLRSLCGDPVIEWMDAAAIAGVEKFARLLGSGGGSDGNAHFSDNFMQNLWDVLPDFDDQRKGNRRQPVPSALESSRRLLNDALFAVACHDHVRKRTSSLFDSGAVGGANATQGMERESLSNPWDVVLLLEGTVCFAGAAAKRLAADVSAEAVFPFQVAPSVTIRDRLAEKERSGSEVWLPLWTRPARSDEILLFLREGRAQCGARPARSGVDMARAIASLGVDRGIQAFRRYIIVKGRVGGDNYNTAALLGRFEVVERSDADLLREADSWLDRFRRACSGKDALPRVVSARRGIDAAVFEFCKYGGASFFQAILVALGVAERELATAERLRSKRKLRPLAGLSADWIKAADDGSAEFAVARAVASIHDPEKKIGPIRSNIEPVVVGRGKQGRRHANWAERERAVVWNAADLATNMGGVLQRRMMDGQRAGCKRLPLEGRFSAPLEVVAKCLAGELDEERIEKLIWGLTLIDDDGARSPARRETPDSLLPRAYALLKLLFLPRPLVVERGAGGTPAARLLRDKEPGGIVIRPEPSVLHLIRGGRLGEACAIAMRRLRASGLESMPGPIRGNRIRDDDWAELDEIGRGSLRAQNLMGALLIPIHDSAVNRIVRLVGRIQETRDEPA
ncbi:MAG: type I-U CRISPR-associated protein Csx17 [Acidobacteriota bacterium]